MAANKEGRVTADIRKTLGRLKGLVLFTNPCGEGWCGQAKRVTTTDGAFSILIKHASRVVFGLIPGSGDGVGWITVTVTPEMVGKDIAVFLSVESKTAEGKERPDQINWGANVRRAGGCSIVARSGADAFTQIGAWLSALRGEKR